MHFTPADQTCLILAFAAAIPLSVLVRFIFFAAMHLRGAGPLRSVSTEWSDTQI